MRETHWMKPTKLWPSGGHGRRVTWLELFFDLVFVAAVAQVGSPLSHSYTLEGLARYGFMFLLVWWAWLGHTMYCTRFDTDDVVQRLLTLLQIFCVAVMAANAKDSLSSRDSAGFGAAYAVMRLVLVAQYGRARRVPETRALASAHALGFGVAAMAWIAAAIVPAPARFWLWGVALLIDLATPWTATQATQKFPPDAAHLPERYGLFTIILLGESMAAVMRGIENQPTWTPAAATTALLGLGLAFGYWWWYFDGAGGAEERHLRSRRQALLFHAWTYAHLPMYLSLAVAGVGVEHVISLPAGAHLHRDDAWILVGAATVAMLALNAIGMTAEHGRGGVRRHGLGLLISLAALPAGALATTAPPCALVIYLAALCALQIGVLEHRAGERRPAPQAEAHALAPARLAAAGEWRSEPRQA